MLETFIKTTIDYVFDITIILAMIVIMIGIIKALWIFIRDIFTEKKSEVAVKESRMELGHAFSLGLGFLVGSSILKTTLAPTWNDIGKLAAIIAIRTILNFILTKEVVQIKNKIEEK